MSGDRNDREWTPAADRRRFLAAVGGTGASAFAGCVFGGGGDGGDGGDEGDGGPGGDGSDADGDATTGDDGTADGGDDGDGGVDTVPPEENPAMPEDRGAFLVPGGEAETTFDATLSEDTVYVGGDTIEAAVDADLAAGRYTLDESVLGRELAEGDVVLISGVALRRVTAVERSGSEATVETEPAALPDAIEEGTVGWDAEVGFDFEHSPDSEARTRTRLSGGDPGTGGPDPAAGPGPGPSPAVPAGGDGVYFAGVEVVDDGESETVPRPEMERTAEGLRWEYSQGGLDYIFEIGRGEEEVTVSVTVQKVVGGNASMALVAEGTVGRARSVASAEYSEGELRAMDLQSDDVGGEVEVSIQAAGSGDGEFNWEFPGLMFKFVVPAGPVPVTIGWAPQIIGAYTVPAEGSATAAATFSYNSSIGFEYTGSETDVDATVGQERIDPEPADSAANVGNAVDLQFGLAFPRLTVSVFEQGLIPYVHIGWNVGSRLTWGPLCKSSYTRAVIQAGYDFEVLGVNFASDKETLYENRREAYGDSCENGGSLDPDPGPDPDADAGPDPDRDSGPDPGPGLDIDFAGELPGGR